MVTTKKCPMCAEQIPLDAVTCNYCGAQFQVTSNGYCQNCHEVREADGNGQCKVCGKAVVDLRVESRLIAEPAQELLPVSQPTTQNEKPITGKRRLFFGILAGISTLIVIGAALWFGRNSIPAVYNLFATITPTPTTTFTPTSTSTATLVPTSTPARTPRPTPLPTTDLRILNPDNQHLYLYVKEGKTWNAARDYCAARGGHLVTIQGPLENRFVYYLAVEGNSEVGTWLGGTDEEKEGTWVWVTGEPWNYWNWDKNRYEPQPDDRRHNIMGADFLTFNPDNRLWSDNDDVERYFVCEWES